MLDSHVISLDLYSGVNDDDDDLFYVRVELALFKD